MGVKPAEAKNVPEEIKEFRKAFEKLLEGAGIEQLVVLIDDLDRCLPDTAIETLEAIRLFVFMARYRLRRCGRRGDDRVRGPQALPGLAGYARATDYARNYLEKLIQVPFRIPALGETETRIYVTLLADRRRRCWAKPTSNIQQLIAIARERLKRPWESGAARLAATVQTASRRT